MQPTPNKADTAKNVSGTMGHGHQRGNGAVAEKGAREEFHRKQAVRNISEHRNAEAFDRALSKQVSFPREVSRGGAFRHFLIKCQDPIPHTMNSTGGKELICCQSPAQDKDKPSPSQSSLLHPQIQSTLFQNLYHLLPSIRNSNHVEGVGNRVL